MAKKYAETLAREYDFTTKFEYFDYIIDSLINGNRSQVKDLFNQMKGTDQKEFLVDYLQNDGSYQTSVKNICIGEFTK